MGGAPLIIETRTVLCGIAEYLECPPSWTMGEGGGGARLLTALKCRVCVCFFHHTSKNADGLCYT